MPDQPGTDDPRLPLQALWRLIRGIRRAMLVTRCDDGQLCARPLVTLNRAEHEDASLWFLVPAHGRAACQLRADPQVAVVYGAPGDQHYVSVTGQARFVDHRARREALWRPLLKTWLPDGPHGDETALVEVRIDDADYWDVHLSKRHQWWRHARAIANGRPAPVLASRRDVDFR